MTKMTAMKLIKEGKTKDVYALGNGNCLLRFKDDATGENGVFDPGANRVGLSIEGLGKSGLRLTEFFFKMLEGKGIPTHFISADIGKAEMTVREAEFFGQGLEIICRYRAVGSFIRRYGSIAEEGQELFALTEFTLKDDGRGDPLITKDALCMLGIMSEAEYETLKGHAKQISGYIAEELEKKGMELYDIKLEFGRADGEIVLIDEISAGNMRVYKDGKQVEPLELARLLLI